MGILNNLLPLAGFVLTILAILGGVAAFRSKFGEQSSTILTQTITALQVRVETLEGQAKDDAKEIARLRQLINTMRHALKRRGLHIEIEGEMVTIIDVDGQRTSTQPPSVAKVAQPTPPRLSRPVKLQPLDDDAS